MTRWLPDDTLAHLRDVAEWPDPGPRYEVTSRLGRGGMGAVFAARDRVLDREVAIKVLDQRVTSGDAARLADEATILARLEHPGIVPVHDAGTLEDGRVYYVMSSQSRPAPLHSGWTRSCASAMRYRSRTLAGSCIATSSRRTSCWGPSARYS
jgi:serine/threonine protein kinase